jgi:signal transduction histidine kinase
MKKIREQLSQDDLLLKQEVFKKYWPVAAIFFSVYIFASFFILKDYLSGWILSVTFLFFITTMVIYHRKKNVGLVSNLFASLGLPTLLPWLVTGGPASEGFWWSLTYVVWAFFVSNKKAAIFWLSTFLFLAVFMVILSFNGVLKIAYSTSELINLLFAYIITFILVYFFDGIREYYLQLSIRREAELSKANAILVSTNAELEQFAYVASHDLQEPLRTISNYVELLDESYAGKKDKDTEQYFKFITTATSRMQTLIKDLMEFSRTGKEPVFTDVDCNKIIKEVITDLDAAIKGSNAKITISQLPVVKGVDVELRRLFQNLISNSLKFRKSNVPPEIDISVKETDTEYLFSVKDNGIGIEEKLIPKLFVIFQRLNPGNVYPGNGIGLVTAKKIVNLHNGKMWVESKFGEGTVFYFTISKKI